MPQRTVALSGHDVAKRIGDAVHESIESVSEGWVLITPNALPDVARFVHD